MTDARDTDLAILAQSVRALADGQRDMREELKTLTNAVTRLAIFEERQARQSDALDRAFKAIERLEGSVNGWVERLDARITGLDEGMDDRITALELEAPAAKRVHDWVFRLVFAAAGALFVFVAHKLGLPITNLP